MQKTARSIVPVLALVALSAIPAFAQTSPPAYDAGELATAASTGVKTAVGSAAPVGFVLLAIMLGVGIAWKTIKRGAKS